MVYIAACGNEASVCKYLKEMEGEYVKEEVQILCGDEIERSGRMPDFLLISERDEKECPGKVPVWFRREAFSDAGEMGTRKAGTILLKNGETILMAKQKFNDFASAYETYMNRR